MKRDESETILLAGALADIQLAQKALSQGLMNEDFRDREAGIMWEYFVAADRNGQALTVEALKALAHQDNIENISDHIQRAALRWPNSDSLYEKTLNKFLDDSRKRRSCNVARSAIDEITEAKDEKEIAKAATLLRRAAGIATEKRGYKVQTSGEVAARLALKIERPVRRLETGIRKLDNVLGGGLDLGRVVSLIGKYKIGKTTLLSTIGYNVAYGAGEKDPDNKAKVLSITLERRESDVEMLNMCRELGINMSDLESKSAKLKGKIDKYISDPARDSIHYYHRPGANLDEICGVITETVRKHGVELVLLDYYQIVGRSGQGRLNDHLMEVDQTINRIADDLNIAILIAAQADADGNPRDSKTLLNSASANFAIRRQDNHPDAWLENLASNYRRQRDAGSPSDPAMTLNEEKGPHFCSI